MLVITITTDGHNAHGLGECGLEQNHNESARAPRRRRARELSLSREWNHFFLILWPPVCRPGAFGRLLAGITLTKAPKATWPAPSKALFQPVRSGNGAGIRRKEAGRNEPDSGTAPTHTMSAKRRAQTIEH